MHFWTLFDLPLLLGFLWQTTLCLWLGLLCSALMRRNPARAHFILVLALMAALLLPLAALVMRYAGGTPALPSPWAARIGQVWLGVGALLLAQLAAGLLLGLRTLSRARPLISERLLQMMQAAMQKLELRRSPAAFTTTDVNCPAIWCWAIHPALLLPEQLAMRPGQLTDTQWMAIFCHQLAHLRRRDHAAAIFAEIACRLLWWQPLAWVCRAWIHRLGDEACDGWVLRGQSAAEYAELLRAMAPQARSLAALSMVSDQESLGRRLAKLGK